VKVVDFGIAKAAIKRIITDQGVLKGRVPYMAPEQCAGKPVDRRSDVFALGIVAYELATVRRLFKGATEFLTMSAIVNGEIPKPSQFRSDVPIELEQIMLMAMALDAVAVKVGVGASTTQLANYMRLQFGDVKEPWLLEDVEVDPETTDVDFDGAASGLAPPPAESVKNNAIPRVIAATRSSPIAQVRNIITPPKATDPVDAPKAGTLVSSNRPTLPTPKKPVPLDKSYSMPTEVEAVSYDHQLDDEPPTEPVELPRPPKTDVASPPPPPLARPTATDATEIVVPLPAMPTERPVYKRPPSGIIPAAVRAGSKRLVYVAAAAAAVIIIAGAIVLWPGSDVPVSAAPERTAQLETEQPAKPQVPVREERKQEPAKQEEPVQQQSALNNTMADYHAAREAAVEEPKVEEPKVEEPNVEEKKLEEKKIEEKKIEEKKIEEKKLEEKKLDDPPVEKPKPVAAKIAKRTPKTTAKLATKRAPPKTTKTTTKKTATKKQKWNPDELFLGD
jgi:serine/threonine-protein kinase